MTIEISKPTKTGLKKKGVAGWAIWEKEVSRFDWFYDQAEECYLLEGKVVVRTKNGEQAEFGKGDFVRFPQGLACEWDIKQPVKKHYRFK
jgi:uncharacterized cupin superfamily protein